MHDYHDPADGDNDCIRGVFGCCKLLANALLTWVAHVDEPVGEHGGPHILIVHGTGDPPRTHYHQERGEHTHNRHLGERKGLSQARGLESEPRARPFGKVACLKGDKVRRFLGVESGNQKAVTK